jgi:hypothetical protein
MAHGFCHGGVPSRVAGRVDSPGVSSEDGHAAGRTQYGQRRGGRPALPNLHDAERGGADQTVRRKEPGQQRVLR